MLQKIIPFYHQLLQNCLSFDDIVIDATCGNGNDTLFLAPLVNHVYAFDIQELAINNTYEKISSLGFTNVSLHQTSHENLDLVVQCPVKAVIYNLGYLPHSDKTITTNEHSTINSLQKALTLLSPQGLIIIALYIGHPGGKEESIALEDFTSQLDSKQYHVLKYQFTNKIDAPFLIIIEKK